MYNAHMKILLTTLNAKYIHKNLALRWLYVASPMKESTTIKEYTIKDDVNRISDDILKTVICNAFISVSRVERII